MASISHLRAALLSALNTAELQDGSQELYEELMSNKSALVNLFAVGPRNPQEQRELENGRIVVDGRSVAVNADFARQVLFIAQHLDVSERYITGLLRDVVSSNPNISQEQLTEAAILEFHTRRRHLTDCLRYIIEAAEVAQNSNAPALYRQLQLFAKKQILVNDFSTKLFSEIQKMADVMNKAQVARQNAKSDTVAPTQQGGQLGSDVLNARCESLRYERRTLAIVLFLLSRMGYTTADGVKNMVIWLQTNPGDPLVYYILPAVLTSFDVVEPHSFGGKARQTVAVNAMFIKQLKTLLGPSAAWKENGLKSLILLKWTLFMTEARHRQPELEDREGFRSDELESQTWNAVQGDCFLYTARVVAILTRKQNGLPPSSYATTLMMKPGGDIPTEPPAEDFIPTVLDTLDALVRTLITFGSSELRKIKQRQEDVLLANARTERTRAFRVSVNQPRHAAAPAAEPVPTGPSRNDIATLFAFMGLLYSSLPEERALEYWGGSNGGDANPDLPFQSFPEETSTRLPAFLQWAVWSTQPKDIEVLTALYDMLTGLAKGQQCSELAYNFLLRGGMDSSAGALGAAPPVSWNAMFALLEQWASAASTPRPQQQSQMHPQQPQQPQGFQQGQSQQAGLSSTQHAHQHPTLILTQQDVLLAQSFLRLLTTVVTFSVPVRITISGHGRFRALPALLALVPLSVPLELKGALFETVSAFCLPGAGSAGAELCQNVWSLMERFEVIDLRAGSGTIATLPPVKGIEVELEEVEAVHKLYPETIPFLRLLSTLIHTPKSVSAQSTVTNAEYLNTIPENLGRSYRRPGIAPYVSFVIDNVFSKISLREYLRPSDRWRMNDLSLCFVERCLASFDLESLVAYSSDDPNAQSDRLLRLAMHPGYDIMKRMLTQSPLQTSILGYLVEGLEGLERSIPEEEPYFKTTITRVLRIVHRVLEIQDAFLDVFLPMLGALEDSSELGEIRPASYYIRLDQSLLYGPPYVPAIATYVAYPTYQEMVLLAVKILTLLASPSTVSRLAIAVSKSGDSVRILDGFQSIMDSSTVVSMDAAMQAEEQTGAGAPDVDEQSDALAQAIRLAVLDFFIDNTQTDRPYPNLAHLLLFGKATADNTIEDPAALGARRACVHSIIDLLNHNVPRLKSKGKRRDSGRTAQTLMITLPGLAERCYRVIYQVCQHPKTSEFSMRYLRSREDFFTRHLAALPFKAPSLVADSFIELQYNDSSRVITTAPDLCAFMRLRSIIFDLTALELHVLTAKNHMKSVSELLDLLYSSEEAFFGETMEDDAFQAFSDVGQSHIRMIEFLQSLDFDWSDSSSIHPIDLEFLGQLDLQSCIRPDESGCQVVDKSALIGLLSAARRELYGRGRILSGAHGDQIKAETNYIMESCVVENNRRRVSFATASCYDSWRRLLDMSLTKCFDRIPPERREGLLFDLLYALPNALRSQNTQEPTAAVLAESILSCLTKLREDRHRLALLRTSSHDGGSGSLPAERLLTLLRSLIDCILDSNRNELVRGNLYASVVNYVHLITNTDLPTTDVNAASLAQSVSRWSISGGVAEDAREGESDSLLIRSSARIVKPVMDRLISLVSRDAIDGAEVWKTVAFMALDSLIRLSQTEKQPAIVLALSRPGFLIGFVQGLKESDFRLQEVLKPDPDDFNILYIYEAKMSLLVRMAQTRFGGEKLLESRLISVLADCDYLDTRPEVDQAFIDRDNFLPSAVQRYHQLLIPALQVVAGILTTFGHNHTSASTQGLEFLKSHRDTAILLLKNETDDLSLMTLEEMRLLVTLSTTILPLIPRTELLSMSGFGGIHNAILHLAARALGNRHWTDGVRPTSDEELTDASVKVAAFGETRFRINLQQKEMDLRKAIVIYLGAASHFTENEFSAVLSPAITTKQDEGASRFIAVIPSVGDAIDALNYVHDGLSQTLKQFLDFSAELASKDHAIENLPEILNLPDSISFENLSGIQRQALINNELQRWQTDARRRAHVLFQLLEMLLLLVWRHLGVYGAEDRPVDIQNLNLSVRLVPSSSFDVSTFRSEAGRKLAPLLHRMNVMAKETLGLGWQSYEQYMEIMSKRLRDTAGLQDAGETEGETETS